MITPPNYRKIYTNTIYEKLVYHIWANYYKPYLQGGVPAHMIDDVRQELRLISIEVEKYRNNKKEAYKAINRLLYRFVRNYGYRRPKGWRYFMNNRLFLIVVSDSLNLE